ncbi:hypothetical protein H5410_044576 [Solanum commersonii]|uniref:Uncharacterized protein n=1 Tax=Solanum commersonii TaxID=4109 RepID=A0A9J5XA48_SOLCO|nr:hypothetical protein H5410_044576 [Solanum commersonii]
MDRFLQERGPFWILQFWLQFTFQNSDLRLWINVIYPPMGTPQLKATASQFTPFSSRKFGPVWFKKSLDPNFQKLNKPELQDIWASYLIARDLSYSILLDESLKCKYGAVPFHQLAYKLPIRRKDFQSADYTKETESSSLVPGGSLISALGTRLLTMSSGRSHCMSSVHLTGKKLLLPDPMILKAIWPEYEEKLDVGYPHWRMTISGSCLLGPAHFRHF